MTTRSRRRSALALPLAFAFAAAVPDATRADPADLLGTYRLEGRTWLHARPFPEREDDVRADAILTQGAAEGKVRVRLAGKSAVCELDATVDDAGALTVPAGQRCPVNLASDRTEGLAEARVLSGKGRVENDVLRLELRGALTGNVRFRPGALGALGRVLAPRSAPVAFEGEAGGLASGHRDRSRASR